MVLPDGLKFLEFGWWVIHAVGIALIWAWAYRKGRKDERRAQLQQRSKPAGQT